MKSGRKRGRKGSSRLELTIGKVQGFITELEVGHEEAVLAQNANNAAIEAARQAFEKVKAEKEAENSVIDNHITSGRKLANLLKSTI